MTKSYASHIAHDPTSRITVQAVKATAPGGLTPGEITTQTNISSNDLDSVRRVTPFDSTIEHDK